MNFKEIKKFIYDNNKIVELLEAIKCSNIRYHNNGYYTAQNIDGDNPGAVVVYNEPGLHVYNYTRTNYFRSNSDIFDLIQYNLSIIKSQKIDLGTALKYLHEFLGIKYQYNDKSNEKKIDPLAIFKKVRSYLYEDIDYNRLEKPDHLKYTTGIIHESWLDLGLTRSTINKFELGYSFGQKRIIIPLKHWKTGEVLGYNRRSVIPFCEEFGIRKYLITADYPKRINVYGLWENREHIEQQRYCVIYEAEKSVLRRDSRLDHTGIALSGHTISSEQVSIICGLDIDEIIIAFDKDISLNEIRSNCEKFYQKRKVSYIYDKHDLLETKDSPADSKQEIFDYLMKTRTVYNEFEHDEYLRYLSSREG